MDTWVPDAVSHTQLPSKKKGKVKEDIAGPRVTFPTLETGSLSPFTLRETNGRLGWTSLIEKSRGSKPEVSRLDDEVLYPATRPAPIPTHNVSVNQQAEGGAHALRTYYPDVDIPAELFREQITAEARQANALQVFDPSVGNLVDVLYFEAGSTRAGIVAFPMGESGCDLSLCELAFSKKGEATLKASASPAQNFNTPIRQLRVAQSLEDLWKPSNLIVRTMATTYIYDVSWMSSGRSSRPGIARLAALDRSHFGDHPVADVLTTRSGDSLVAVNDAGEVYHGRVDQSSFNAVGGGLGKDESEEGGFYKLAYGNFHDNCFVLGSRSLAPIDLRTSEIGPPVFTSWDSTELFTSVAISQDDSLIRLVTTSRILWFDERYNRRPVLAYKHHREYDRTLEASIIDVGRSSLTVLHSRKNGLLTIYDAYKETSNPIRLRSRPQSAILPSPYDENLGFHFLQPPFKDASQQIPVLRLSPRGALLQTSLSFTLEDESIALVIPPSHVVTQWDEEVRQTDRSSNSLRHNLGAFGHRDHHIVNLRPLYEDLFMSGADTSTANADSLESVLEKMPYFWQEADGNTDAMLTGADIAFRSGEDPSDPVRADFLTGNAFDGVRGQRAYAQGRIPIEVLRARAPWHRNLLPFMSRYVTDTPISEAGLSALPEALHKYDLKMDDYRTGPSLRREAEARQQLALDLALSSHIYAPHSFAKNTQPAADDDALEVMSRATQAMSLDDDLPPVRFGYLRPGPKQTLYRDTDDSPPETRSEQQPLGVRLLLQEWDTGTNPGAYEYHDPYGVDSVVSAAIAGPRQPGVSRRLPPRPAPAPGPSHSQRAPPIIVAKQAPPPIFAASQPTAAPTFGLMPPRVGATQPQALRKNASMDVFGPESSQSRSQGQSQSQVQEMASTQVMPGPFGGRPPLVKKPMKKRMGGF